MSRLENKGIKYYRIEGKAIFIIEILKLSLEFGGGTEFIILVIMHAYQFFC